MPEWQNAIKLLQIIFVKDGIKLVTLLYMAQRILEKVSQPLKHSEQIFKNCPFFLITHSPLSA